MLDSTIWDKLQMSYAEVGIKCATVFILKGKEKYEKIHIVPPVGVWIISERQKLAELAISQKGNTGLGNRRRVELLLYITSRILNVVIFFNFMT